MLPNAAHLRFLSIKHSNPVRGGRVGALFLVALSICFLVSHYLPAQDLVSKATFVKVDATTRGNWKGHYGAEGYNLIADKTNYPPCVKVIPNDNLFNIFSHSTTDEGALQRSAGNDRMIGVWYRWGQDYFTINLAFTDELDHQLALYFLDALDPNDQFASRQPRIESIEILATFSRTALDSQTLTNFSKGKYLVWNVRGQVTVKVKHLQGDNAVLSGFFFDKPVITAKNEH